MNERQSKILDLVSKERKVRVKELAKKCDVSEVTIRKDLDELSDLGLLERRHGYAVLRSSDDISVRLAFRNKEKRAIAEAAADSVDDGETIMIESGSTCALLAEEIATSGKKVKIITNSAYIASYIRKLPGAKIILIGGEYQNQSEVCVGPIARSQADLYNVEKLFAGTDGFNEKRGFTGGDALRIDVVREMAKNAEEVVILTDSSKFSQKGLLHQFNFSEVDKVFTDKEIPEAAQRTLDRAGVEVIKA